MSKSLEGKKVAVLVENGFEEIELVKPVEALKGEGAEIKIISPQEDKVKAWDRKDWGKEYDVDINIEEAKAIEFNALLLPGGVMNPDYLRMNTKAVQFVESFFSDDKPVAAICHGPWTLIEAGVVKDRTVTSYPSLKTDLQNAGAEWIDEEVVVDGKLVTSRNPDDLPAFNKKAVEVFGGHKQ